MTAFAMSIIADVLTCIIGALLLAQSRQLRAFRKEQREVNKSNALANRSLQRDVLYRYFHYVIERGEQITPEELEHVTRCYEAYHANGGNGAGTLMYERIMRHVKLDTGREG